MNKLTNYWGDECIILSRVSTQNQDFTPQNDDLENYAKSLGFTKIEIIATKESGFKKFDSKDGFNLVVEYIKLNPQCKTIFVTELSRIGRNRQVITNIEYYLRENKINLIVKDTNLFLFDEFGNYNANSAIMFAIYSSFAESEMNQKKERFSRAKKKYFADGLSITGIPLFGYTRIFCEKVQKNRYEINPDQANQIKQIFDWYINGIDGDVSKSSISLITLECIKKGFDKYLHSKRNVNKCLKEMAYLGEKTTNNKMKNPEYWQYGDMNAPRYINASQSLIKYPVILSENIHNLVQNKMKNNNTSVDKSKHITILSKLIVCPSCGRYMSGEYLVKDGVVKHVYRCTHSKVMVNKCPNKQTLSMVQLDSVVWCFIKQNISELIEKINTFHQNIDVSDIESEIENLKNKIADYQLDIETESIIFRNSIKKTTNRNLVIDEYDSKINNINSKIEKLELIINERFELIQKIELDKKENKQEIKNRIDEIEKSKSELRKYIRMLINKIVPVYSCRKYTVLKLTINENIGSNLNLSDWVDGLQKPKKLVTDGEYYIIVNKINNNKIRVKYIENLGNINFENDSFILNNNYTSVNEIFDFNNVNMLDEPFINFDPKIKKQIENNMIAFHLNDLKYVRFGNSLYIDDIVKVSK